MAGGSASRRYHIPNRSSAAPKPRSTPAGSPPRKPEQPRFVRAPATPHRKAIMGWIALGLVAMVFITGVVALMSGLAAQTSAFQWLVVILTLLCVTGLVLSILGITEANRFGDTLARTAAIVALVIAIVEGMYLLPVLLLALLFASIGPCCCCDECCATTPGDGNNGTSPQGNTTTAAPPAETRTSEPGGQGGSSGEGGSAGGSSGEGDCCGNCCDDCCESCCDSCCSECCSGSASILIPFGAVMVRSEQPRTQRLAAWWQSLDRRMFAHHPAGPVYAADVLRTGRWEWCIGCVVTYPVFLLAATAGWALPSLLPSSPTLLGVGTALASAQIASAVGWTRTRARKIAVKAALGVGLAMIVLGVVGAGWPTWLGVVVLLSTMAIAAASAIPRKLRMRRGCQLHGH